MRMNPVFTPVLSVMMLGAAVVASGCHAAVVVDAPPQPAPQPVVVAPAPAPTPAPTPVPPPAPKVVVFEHDAHGGLKLPGPVVFAEGSDKLKPESDTVLQIVKDYLDAKPEITVLRVEGHTDADGTPDGNLHLSGLRAMAVARWLTAKGADCKRLLPVAFGQTKPIADNTTADGKAQNRRTAFVNAELKHTAIAHLPEDGGGKVAGDPCK
jgi:OmpA-OmpF porin, OOP family